MKILVAFFCLFSLAVSAQPGFGIARRDSLPCYQKSIDKSKQRYTEWECGKIAGVVDCNQKLEMSSDGKRVVTSSQKMPFSGICETCHMNGVLERRVTFVDGFANGIDTTYYKSGCIMVVRSHIQGVEDGHWTYYNDSTQIPAWEKTYRMGQFEGPQLTYNQRGDTAKLEYYTEGVLNGAKITYDSKGGRSQKANYVKGVLEGPFLLYNRKGEIIEELNYKEGKKHGVQHYYYDDGKLLRTETWDMDSRNGEFKTLFYNQTLQSIENYKKVTPKPNQYVTAELYACQTEQIANALGQMLYDKKTKAQALDSLKDAKIDVTLVRGEAVSENAILKGNNLAKGVNKPIKSGKLYYIAVVSDLKTMTKTEVREGLFEDRFPDGRLKSRAIYKKDVLIEEHVFDEQGREIRTFGGTAASGKEDDAMPTTTKQKKEKKKKEPKKKKEEPKPTEGL